MATPQPSTSKTVPDLLPNLTVFLEVIRGYTEAIALKIENADQELEPEDLDNLEYACRHALYLAQWFLDHRYDGPDIFPPNPDGTSPLDPTWHRSFGPAPKWRTETQPLKHQQDG